MKATFTRIAGILRMIVDPTVKWIDRFLEPVMIVLVAAMALSICTEIFTRQVLQPVLLSRTQSLQYDRVLEAYLDAHPAVPHQEASRKVTEALEERQFEALGLQEADLPEKSWEQAQIEAFRNRLTGLSGPVNTASQTLLVWVGILGGALAWRRRAHLGVDVFVRLFPARIRLFMDYLSSVLVAAFSATVLLYGGWLVCYNAIRFGSKMPGFEQINRAWLYSVLPLTGVLCLIYCLYHILHPEPVGPFSDTPQETNGKESTDETQKEGNAPS